MQLLAYSAAYTLAPNLNNNSVFPKSVLRPPHNRCFEIYLPRRTGHGRAVSGEKLVNFVALLGVVATLVADCN